MTSQKRMIAFGPVPSRRLGRSLGINHIPPKHCTYSCIYCQLGRTNNMRVDRCRFFDPMEVFNKVERKVQAANRKGELIDFLTFVADGEPSLDINLGREIEMLKKLNKKIAVISNASLIWREDVREELGKADWVSLKVDSVNKEIWRKIDRPHGSIELDKILEGIREFSGSFGGELVTETMLVRNLNDHGEEIERIADFIVEIGPHKSYLSIPTRPPAEQRALPPDEPAINMAFQIFKQKGIKVEYLIGYEGNEFAFTGSPEEDILGITSVHPMREDALGEFLKKAGSPWHIVAKMIDEGKLIELRYGNDKFYMRKLLNLKRD